MNREALVAEYWEHYLHVVRDNERDDGRAETLWDRVDELGDAASENPPGAVELLVAAAEAAPDEAALAFLGAGPVEELLVRHAAEVVDAVDAAAQVSERFRYALRCAWFDDELPAEIATRLRRFGPAP